MTRSQHAARPRRESLGKRLGKVARQIAARDGHMCVYCGATAESSGSPLHLDHLTPRELGGSHEADNLVTACLHCNSARRDLTLRAWLTVLRDGGTDTDGMARRIRTLTARTLDLSAGKAALAARRGR